MRRQRAFSHRNRAPLFAPGGFVGRLKIIRSVRPSVYLVECPCGASFEAILARMKAGDITSCKKCAREEKLTAKTEAAARPSRPIEIGDKIGRLTVIKKLPNYRHVVQCECGSPEFEMYSTSLRQTSRRFGCKKCIAADRKMAVQIEQAKRAIAESGRLLIERPSQHWEYQGDEDALAAKYGGGA